MSRTRVPVVFGQIFDRRVRADNAGIVDQDVEATPTGRATWAKARSTEAAWATSDGKADGRTAYFSRRPLRAVDIYIERWPLGHPRRRRRWAMARPMPRAAPGDNGVFFP